MLSFVPALMLLAAPQAAQATAAPKISEADKIICKRSIETGSLVRGVRTCKTKRDWERDRDIAKSNLTVGNGCRELNGTGGC